MAKGHGSSVLKLRPVNVMQPLIMHSHYITTVCGKAAISTLILLSAHYFFCFFFSQFSHNQHLLSFYIRIIVFVNIIIYYSVVFFNNFTISSIKF